jgi:hypothetical protein
MPAPATIREPARRQRSGYRPLAGRTPAVALGIEFEDGGVVHEPVDRRDGDGGIGEDLAPFAERLIAALVALGDGRCATLITSQIPVDRWHDLIGEPTLADAILDRIIHNAHRLQLSGDSLRKQKAPKIGAA